MTQTSLNRELQVKSAPRIARSRIDGGEKCVHEGTIGGAWPPRSLLGLAVAESRQGLSLRRVLYRKNAFLKVYEDEGS